MSSCHIQRSSSNYDQEVIWKKLRLRKYRSKRWGNRKVYPTPCSSRTSITNIGSASYFKLWSGCSRSVRSRMSFLKARTHRSSSSAVCLIWLSTELRKISPTAFISDARNSIASDWWKGGFLANWFTCSTCFASWASYSSLSSNKQALQKRMSSSRRPNDVEMRRGNSSGSLRTKLAIPFITAKRRWGRYLTIRFSTCTASSRTPGSILMPCWGIISVILSLRPTSSIKYGMHFSTDRKRCPWDFSFVTASGKNKIQLAFATAGTKT